jgi:DNA-binding MarR family transcriptional regulator
MKMAGTTKLGGILMPTVRSALSDLNQIHYKTRHGRKRARFSPKKLGKQWMSQTVRSNGKRAKSRTGSQSRRVSGSDTQLTVSLPQFLVDGTDLQFREFVADLFAATGGLQSLRRALAKSVGLSAAEFSVLLATWHLQKRGRVGVSGVARHLHVAAAHVTAEIGKLVQKGFVKKAQDVNDTRAVTLVLTRKGEGVLAELAPLLRRINDRLFSGNSSNAVSVVAKFLRHVADESANSIRMARNFSG